MGLQWAVSQGCNLWGFHCGRRICFQAHMAADRKHQLFTMSPLPTAAHGMAFQEWVIQKRLREKQKERKRKKESKGAINTETSAFLVLPNHGGAILSLCRILLAISKSLCLNFNGSNLRTGMNATGSGSLRVILEAAYWNMEFFIKTNQGYQKRED